LLFALPGRNPPEYGLKAPILPISGPTTRPAGPPRAGPAALGSPRWPTPKAGKGHA